MNHVNPPRIFALSFTVLVGMIALLWPSCQVRQAEHGTSCDTPVYTVRIISYDPFMMHVENFLSQKELSYLLAAG